MAQLKSSKIDGDLEVTNKLILQANKGIYVISDDTGEELDLFRVNNAGNAIFGYSGYMNKNGDTHIYGNDIRHYVASAGNVFYRPYYKAGDTIPNIEIKTAGLCSSSGRYIRFIVPLDKPVIGNPVVTATSVDGFILLQNGEYTHDSDSGIFVNPQSYMTNLGNGYVEITGVMSTTTKAINRESIGIHWSGTLTFS